MTTRSVVAGKTGALERTKLFMQFHERLDKKDALDHFPETLLALLDTIQPSSVSVERTFETFIAKRSRNLCQGRLDDHRFMRKLLVKYFYRKNKPWEGSHPSGCKVMLSKDTDTSDSDGEPSSESVCHIPIAWYFKELCH